MVYIVMGVSGSGKSTIGSLLAGHLGLPYHDADDYHPSMNLRKMERGIPLNHADRSPWLGILAEKIEKWDRGGGAVLACSALREDYRQELLKSGASMCFIFLKGNRDTIMRRLNERQDHFFPFHLLDSQFADLEEPDYGLTVSVEGSPEEICREIQQRIKIL
jgi:carbohydrate kinase (thermoresistant glucokinase family)